jgi:hypothetical protein
MQENAATCHSLACIKIHFYSSLEHGVWPRAVVTAGDDARGLRGFVHRV